MTGLQLHDVSIGIDDRILFDHFDLTVVPGEMTTIMGPSGCGKSSLLSHICGTLTPTFETSGTVRLNGRDISHLPPEQRRIGILFQDDLLFPHLSVGENLMFALPKDIGSKHDRKARVETALIEADLKGFAERDPATLSGGQRARVALMRTLLASPACLLLDEPFAKLDIELRHRVRTFVLDHARDVGVPALLVTHEASDAEAAGGSVITLSAPSA